MTKVKIILFVVLAFLIASLSYPNLGMTSEDLLDSRFSSPGKTWELYKQGLLMGDLALVQSCLSPYFAENHMEALQALGKEKIKKIAEAMKSIEKVAQNDNTALYRIKRIETIRGEDRDITYHIEFINISGNWKILQY